MQLHLCCAHQKISVGIAGIQFNGTLKRRYASIEVSFLVQELPAAFEFLPRIVWNPQIIRANGATSHAVSILFPQQKRYIHLLERPVALAKINTSLSRLVALERGSRCCKLPDILRIARHSPHPQMTS